MAAPLATTTRDKRFAIKNRRFDGTVGCAWWVT
jgi:hypothetical protein